MAQYEEMMAGMGGLDPLSAPVPGESLTASPDTKAPYEKPPKHTDVDTAMEDLFVRITEPEILDELLNLMRSDMSVEDIAQVILFGGFREGNYNPDLMLLMIEPTIYVLLWLADYAGIDASLMPEESMSDLFGDDEEGSSEMPTDVTTAPVPEGISPDLLSKIKAKAGKGE